MENQITDRLTTKPDRRRSVGARGETRTHTPPGGLGGLSPLRLPIPPPGPTPHGTGLDVGRLRNCGGGLHWLCSRSVGEADCFCEELHVGR